MKRSARKFSIADVRLAIREVGSSPAVLAKRLNCSRGTIYNYLRLPELADVVTQTPKSRPQKTREAFEAAIRGSRGIKQRVAEALGVTRQTVDNYFGQWPDLMRVFEDERNALVDRAESKLVDAVESGDMRATIFTLETLGKNRGWARRTEVTGADGGAVVISSETLELIQSMGLDASQVVREFEGFVRAAALEQALDSDKSNSPT